MNKKELIKQYKETLQPMGIYQIKNNSNGKIYIGKSRNINGKINSERFQLKNGLHNNRQLQNDFTTLGENNFTFDAIDILKPDEDKKRDYTDDLNSLEDMWLEKLQPFNDKGYNKK